MGIGQSKSHNMQRHIRQKYMYNCALNDALDNKLKYITEHKPWYHGNFGEYLSNVNDNFDEEVYSNYYNLIMTSSIKKT